MLFVFAGNSPSIHQVLQWLYQTQQRRLTAPSTEELLRYSRAADLQALQQVPLNVLRAYCHQQFQCAVSDDDFKDAAEGEDIRVRATTLHTTIKQADLFEQQKAETQARDLLIGFMAEDNVSMETLNKIQSTEFLSKQVSHH